MNAASNISISKRDQSQEHNSWISIKRLITRSHNLDSTNDMHTYINVKPEQLKKHHLYNESYGHTIIYINRPDESSNEYKTEMNHMGLIVKITFIFINEIVKLYNMLYPIW